MPCRTCSMPMARCSISTPPSPATDAAAGPDADAVSPRSGGKAARIHLDPYARRPLCRLLDADPAGAGLLFRAVSVGRPQLRADLLDAYLKLDAFPDAQQVLRRAEGARRTHRDPDQRLAGDGRPRRSRRPGSRPMLDAVLSVDTVKMFKPRPEVYALVTLEFSCEPAEVMFVSSNRWDAMGATAFGFRTVWINRAKAPDEYGDFPPAATVADLHGLLIAAALNFISADRFCRSWGLGATRPTRSRTSSSRRAQARRSRGRSGWSAV